MAADASKAIEEGKVTLEEWAEEMRYGIYNTPIFQARNKINALQALDKVLVELGGTSVFDERLHEEPGEIPDIWQEKLEEYAGGKFRGQIEPELRLHEEPKEMGPLWSRKLEEIANIPMME